VPGRYKSLFSKILSKMFANFFFQVECAENEEYTTCGSGCGDLTCKERNGDDRICPAVCREGCFCSKGFVRGDNGKCIKVKDCPAGNANRTLNS
jgi:hypothetical protein